jgi:hypothetical protein
MELTDRVQRVIEREFGPQGQNLMGRGLSAATFAPELPAPRGDTASFARRGVTNRQLEAHRAEFLASDYVRMDSDSGAELWRISLRVAATKGIDYGAFVADLKSAVAPVLSAHDCRERVLREVVDQRGGKRHVGAKVLLLGMPSAALTQDAADSVPGDDANPDAGAPAQGDREVIPVNDRKIFARTLYDLLNISRVRVAAHIVDVTPLPENWRDIVAQYDCVVLLDDAGYDLSSVQAAAQRLVDARQHRQIASTVDHTPAAEPAATEPAKFAAVYTGIVPIVYKAQRTLLDSLIQSTFWSFITITPLMILVARSIRGGLVAMLPNVLPVLVVFGAMGWLGVNVDVGSMMTASVALGVAVDDTIHYLNWFREELDHTGDRKLAILATYRHCATPTLQAAIISGLGLSVFALSTFTPTQRFGVLMLAILWTGMIAELIFFPALLAGPLGAVFKPRTTTRSTATDSRQPHTSQPEAGTTGTAHSQQHRNSLSERVH